MWRLCVLMGSTLLMAAGTSLLLRFIRQIDRETMGKVPLPWRGMVPLGSLLWGLLCCYRAGIGEAPENRNVSMIRFLSLLVWGIYLLTCSITDQLTFYVYSFLHYPTLLAGILYWYTMDVTADAGWAILFYGLVHLLLFSKLFGRGDSLVYVISAFFLTGPWDNALRYLCHMALTFALLGVISLLKGNINKRGNLKHPVALVPYIMVAAWMCLIE